MARVELIEKVPNLGTPPNVREYQEAIASFSWDAAYAELDRLPGGRGLNIAHEAVDRHAAGPRASHVALRFLDPKGGRDVTFAELKALTNRFANVLRAHGVGRGDRVCTLLGRAPELYVTALGTLKNGSVYSPLFPTFGPEPIRARLGASAARVLVPTEALYRRNVETLRRDLPELRLVLLVGCGAPERTGTACFEPLLSGADPRFEIPPTDPEDPALLHFTSGTTAGLKGVVHVHAGVVGPYATGKLVLDLHPDDVYWCPASPGWVTATSYGIIAPLTNGVTAIVDAAELEPERCYRVLQDERVTVWYTTPTTLRVLRKAGADVAWSYDLSSLRFVASVGEPLDAELLRWAADVLGQPVHDNWWQTETGCIMVANLASMPIKPGSMGRPVPGIRAAVVRRGERVEVVEAPDSHGELALAAGWPSMFRGYHGDEERYRACFADGWYLTGDQVRRDAEGYYWFLGRGDDLIKSAGQIIGPFEVESALLEHPAIAEAGAIGKPDPMAHEVVKAFVTLKRGFEPGDELRHEILAWSRTRLGEEVAPRELDFLASLPRTPSGKLMRRLLKARELGLPVPDATAVDDDA